MIVRTYKNGGEFSETLSCDLDGIPCKLQLNACNRKVVPRPPEGYNIDNVTLGDQALEKIMGTHPPQPDGSGPITTGLGPSGAKRKGWPKGKKRK